MLFCQVRPSATSGYMDVPTSGNARAPLASPNSALSGAAQTVGYMDVVPGDDDEEDV